MRTILKNITFINQSYIFKTIHKKTLYSFSISFNKSPEECYYKTLNSSPTSSLEEIKKEYYKLAKKFHPDNNNSNSKENQGDKFKIVSESYEVLSDPKKRSEYDKLILGIFDNQSFSNQDAYEFYKTKLKTPTNRTNVNAKYRNNSAFESQEKSVNTQYQKQYDNEIRNNPYFYQSNKINDIHNKLKSGVPIDDACEAYNKHKENYKENNKLNSLAWQDAKYKFDRNYDPFNTFYAEKTYKDKYNMHNIENVILDQPYWDTKENDEFYKLSRWKRLKLYVKESVLGVPIEFYVFNFLFLLMIIFYANKKSRQIIS